MPFNKKYFLILVLLAINIHSNAQTNEKNSISSLFANAENIKGKQENLITPYNTAGDKLYVVGNQDGSFPDIGWHIKGEMGGVWHHPIKLLDGFEASIAFGGVLFKLNHADNFINYPFGNKFIYNTFSNKIAVERYQFVPDDIAASYIGYIIKNKTNKTIKVHFSLKVISNLRPVWLGERTNMVNGKDTAQFNHQNNYWEAKDDLNSWYAIYGTSIRGYADKKVSSKPDKLNTSITNTEYIFEIKPNAEFNFPFVIAGSAKNKEEALDAYTNLSNNAYALLTKKKKRLASINNLSQLTLNDKDLERTFRWLKYDTDWLTMNVNGMGKSLCAGLPDYPFLFGCDMSYTIKGLIGTGRKDIAYSTIDLINSVSEKTNGNGRIIHEVSTNGAVNNPGNICETPQFISMLWDVFRWTGDKAFLIKYFPTVEKGLSWLLKENDANGDLIPDGNGMMEIQGLDTEMIDVATYAQEAFADASKMAKILGKDSLAIAYQKKAEILEGKINHDFWSNDFNSYADFISTKQQALKLIDDAEMRANTQKNIWAIEELSSIKKKIEADSSNNPKGFVIYHNWVVNSPMETGIATPEKASRALKTAEKFTSPFGMFVTGIDWSSKAATDTGSYNKARTNGDFTYTGTVMTLPTSVQIIAENNYGNTEAAYALLKKASKTFSYALPGSMYEVSPDYGMMTQAWNIYGFGKSIIEQFFGIKPFAYNNEITIHPMLPKAFKVGKLENITTGNNEISIGFSQKTNQSNYAITQKNKTWKIIFVQPKGKYSKWILNGQKVKPMQSGNLEQVIIHGKLNKLQLLN